VGMVCSSEGGLYMWAGGQCAPPQVGVILRCGQVGRVLLREGGGGSQPPAERRWADWVATILGKEKGIA